MPRFDRAEEALSKADDPAGPDWTDWFDEAELYGALASSHLDLGHPALA